MKTFCPTHCFNYTGSVCPYCEADRIAAYSRRYNKSAELRKDTAKTTKQQAEKQQQDEPKEITVDMLDALKAKWGSR